jgi:hypothetical protein
MVRAKVVIHIGPPKTGSSSIQDFFCKRTDALLNQRVLYPKSGRLLEGETKLVNYPLAPQQQLSVSGIALNHRLLAWSIRGSVVGVPKDYFWQQLHDEINAHSPDIVFISAEQFGNLHRHEISILKELTMRLDIDPTILYFSRCPIRHLYSSYCERMKMGISSQSLSSFLKNDGDSFLHEQNQIPKNWGSFFGVDNITSIDFDRAIKEGGLECTVLQVLGLKAEGFDALKPQNSSPSPNVLEILRFLNWLHHDCIGRSRFSDIAFRSLRGRALNRWGFFRLVSSLMGKINDPATARERHFELIQNWLSDTSLSNLVIS